MTFQGSDGDSDPITKAVWYHLKRYGQAHTNNMETWKEITNNIGEHVDLVPPTVERAEGPSIFPTNCMRMTEVKIVGMKRSVEEGLDEQHAKAAKRAKVTQVYHVDGKWVYTVSKA
jgi:hypothetical protein